MLTKYLRFKTSNFCEWKNKMVKQTYSQLELTIKWEDEQYKRKQEIAKEMQKCQLQRICLNKIT